MNTISLFSRRLKKLISSLVAASLVATSTLPGLASAQTCDAYSARSGQSAECAAKDIGGVPVAYPKFTWTQLSELATVAPQGGALRVQGGPQAISLANRTALALNLDSSVVGMMTSLTPSNVPYVLGRYNPMDGTLRIDVFKLEKTTGAGAPVVRLLQSQFTPRHGDAWKASRAYISPDEFKSGNTPGVNPFSSFIGDGNGIFQNISLNAAQVAIGHAMRAHGAGLGALAITDTRVSTVTTKSGGVFKKTVRTYVYGHAKPQWMLAVPRDVLRNSNGAQEAAYCATDPSRTDCPLYQTAASGVTFESFSGGTLSAAEDTWLIDFQKKSGLTFIGALFLGVLGSFALAGLMSGAGAAAAAGSSGATLGSFGSALLGNSALISQTAAIAFEAAVVAGKMVLIGGANLSSIININGGVLLGTVGVNKGLFDPPALTAYDQKILANVKGQISQAPTTRGGLNTGVANTVFGEGCGVDSTAAACASSGSVPRVDTYQESRSFEFVKDANGQVLRQNAPF